MSLLTSGKDLKFYLFKGTDKNVGKIFAPRRGYVMCGSDEAMLKYQVRPSSRPSIYGIPSSLPHGTTLTSRSSSLASLSSVDSANSESDWGTLRIYTNNVKACTDYKTIRVSTQSTTRFVIQTVIDKFKISCRDTNLFELWMEITTKANGKALKTILRLDHSARPLELQRCHPSNMSRFMLHMNSEGTLVRVHDHNICPQSNYKSLLLAEETTCLEVVDILLCMNRKEPDGDYALFLTAPDGEAQIPSEVPLVPIALMCRPYHKIVIRQVDTL